VTLSQEFSNDAHLYFFSSDLPVGNSLTGQPSVKEATTIPEIVETSDVLAGQSGHLDTYIQFRSSEICPPFVAFLE
jgi:hypothetical protein